MRDEFLVKVAVNVVPVTAVTVTASAFGYAEHPSELAPQSITCLVPMPIFAIEPGVTVS